MSRRVLVVPGLGLTAESWGPTFTHLPAGYLARVVSVPGYGRPRGGEVDLRPRALAETVASEMADEDDWLLAGHSASCQVVAHAAALLPERVSGVVLVGPTTDPRGADWFSLAGRWLATAVREDPRQVPSLVRQYRRTGLRTMAGAMEAARRDRIEKTLASVGCPVLVARGRHDRICPPGWAEAVSRSGRGAGRVVTTASGGHMLPLTRGARLAEAVAGFAGPIS